MSHLIHCLPALEDNYIWLIQANDSADTIIVDPGDGLLVQQYITQHALKPVAIFITHGCYDHIMGIDALVQHYPLPVYGPANEVIPHCSHPLSAPCELTLPHFAPIKVLSLPGHTIGHLGYHLGQQLFSGDVLFAGGCGVIRAGRYQQGYASLMQIAALADDTLVYYSHEYTQSNLLFGRQVEPDNTAIQQRLTTVLNTSGPTLPTSLAIEHETNPFLRCHHPAVQQAVEDHSGRPLQDNLAIFTVLRQWKDHFKPLSP